ncbi:hypothetical protein PVAND_008129 [Polypedilum vanderplanki]|uniref:CCC domain-containing protein n=1 Tax=Polypedilum vanderplanki TaxID=319348 RepID=A0A9J6C8R5_POLVA|nr:hypothetical protein PVAND_008129 [Polypedilum vanderplanki]
MQIVVSLIMLLTCDLSLKSALSASAIDTQSDKKSPTTTITEYFKDHEVSDKMARESLRAMKDDEFETPPYCKKCTEEQQRYCHSDKLLKDHCCCNQSHRKEQLYFIPHECYINYDRCYPSLGSCLEVMHIRSCCCDAQLKKHWKSILGTGSKIRSSKFLLWTLPLALLLIAVY